MLFLTYLVDRGVQSSTIRSYTSAIKHILVIDGYNWDDKQVMLTTITKSCRLINDAIYICLPIKSRLLDALLFELECHFAIQPYLEKMYKAVFSISYYGLMRISEVAAGAHPVRARDVHVGMNKDKILLLLHTSKTHGKESHPQKIKIHSVYPDLVKKKLFCPFQLMHDFISIRGIYEEDTEPFFILPDRSPLKRDQFRDMLKLQLARLDLDPTLYNCYSFHIGRIVDMASFGYSFSALKKAGRWKSSAIFKYLKT